MAEVTLRLLNLEDRDELHWLYDFIHQYHSTPKEILPTLEDLKHPGHRYFQALNEKKEVIGMTSYEIRTRYLVETQKTVVDPHYRGKGYGKAISLAVEKLAKNEGYTKIRTTIYSDNLKMIQIKLEQGYQIEGFHPNHEAPGLDEYSLGKFLGQKTV